MDLEVKIKELEEEIEDLKAQLELFKTITINHSDVTLGELVEKALIEKIKKEINSPS